MTETLKKKLKILVVDDNQLNLMVMRSIFNETEYEVFYADCGIDALNMAREILPSMILLDVIMPDISGFDVCSALKKEDYFKDIPIIFITVLEEIEFIIRGFDVGGIDYITKPFRKEEILLRIKTHFDLKLTRDQLLETTRSLSELNKVKDRLFSIIGHDLRSPIGNVKMVLEFMSKGIIDPLKGDNYKKTINELLNTTDEVFVLLENLLTWARNESGNLHNIPEKIKIREAISSIVNLYQAGINTKNIEIKIDVDPDHVVYADMNMIKTVIRNLFSNALKFSPMCGVISFSSEKNDNRITVSVSDNGVGMSHEAIEKILHNNVFYSTMGLNMESGNGLGLKLCKEFIEKSKGEIRIESAPGAGTTVYFTLPCESVNEEINKTAELVW